ATTGINAAGTMEINAGTSLTGTSIVGSTVLSNLPNTINIPLGTVVTGPGMPSNVTVTSILSPTAVLLSAVAATGATGPTSTGSFTFAGVSTGETAIGFGGVGVGSHGVLLATGSGTATISAALGAFPNSATVGV